MSPKAAIVILVVAVLLFAVALGSGVRSGPGSQSDAKPGPLGGLLGGVLVRPLDLQTVKGSPSSCVLAMAQQVVVPPGRTCKLTVPKAGPATRRLTYGQGTMFLTFTPAGGSFTPTPSPTRVPQDTRNFDVVASGGEVDVLCQLGQFCVLKGAV